MAVGYFGTVFPSTPSQISDGEYEGVIATGSQGGTGKSLVIRVSGNGVVVQGILSDLTWVGLAQQSYVTTLEFPSSFEGTGLKATISFFNNGGAPATDTGSVLTSKDFISKGSNYRLFEEITFTDGVVSGKIRITEVSTPQFSILEVLEDGQDYTNEDTLVVTKAEFLRVQPSAYYSGANLWIPFFGSTSNAGVSTGAALSVSYKNDGREIPLLEGVYKNLPVSGGSGSGLTVDLTVVGSGGSITAIGEKSGWGIPADTAEVKEPVPVLVSGGSGSGASVYIGLRKLIENSSNKQIPDRAYGFYTNGVATGGVGYDSSDVLSISRSELINAGFSLNALHAEESLSIRGISAPSVAMDVSAPGTGFVNGESASISSVNLSTAGATVSGGSKNLSISIRTVNEYGYPGVPSKSYSSYTSAGIYLGYANKTTQWDAKDGVLSERTTWTTGDQGRPLAPESSGAPSIPTKEGSTTITLRSSGYVEDLPGAGPFVQQESMPVPLYQEAGDVAATVSEYSKYLKRFMLGDFYGTTIQEGVRIEVYQNWTPNMPFRYVDPFNDKISAMRMDATTWTVDNSGSVFSTNGIWIGDSNGSLGISPNVQGVENAPTPGFADTTGLPYPAQNVSGTGGGGAGSTLTRNVVIQNETYIDFGDYVETFEVFVGKTIEMDLTIQGVGQVISFPVNNILNNITEVMYVRGEVVTAGDTIDATNNGGIPAAQGDTLLTDDFTIVTEDLFA